MRLTCPEFVDFIDDYLARALPAETHAAFERHLAVCPACVTYLDGYRASIQLSRAALPGDEGLGDVPEGLIQAILESCRR